MNRHERLKMLARSLRAEGRTDAELLTELRRADGSLHHTMRALRKGFGLTESEVNPTIIASGVWADHRDELPMSPRSTSQSAQDPAEQSIKANIAWGVKYGLGFATMLSLCTGLAACDHTQPLVTRPVSLGPTHTRVAFGSVIRATGPTRELCFVVAARDLGRLVHDGPQRTLQTPVHAVLLTADGQRDSLDAAVAVRRPDMVCLWDHGLANSWNAAHVRVSADGNTISPPRKPRPPLSREYAAVELWSDVPVQLREMRWWSGQRTIP